MTEQDNSIMMNGQDLNLAKVLGIGPNASDRDIALRVVEALTDFSVSRQSCDPLIILDSMSKATIYSHSRNEYLSVSLMDCDVCRDDFLARGFQENELDGKFFWISGHEAHFQHDARFNMWTLDGHLGKRTRFMYVVARDKLVAIRAKDPKSQRKKFEPTDVSEFEESLMLALLTLMAIPTVIAQKYRTLPNFLEMVEEEAGGEQAEFIKSQGGTFPSLFGGGLDLFVKALGNRAAGIAPTSSSELKIVMELIPGGHFNKMFSMVAAASLAAGNESELPALDDSSDNGRELKLTD